VEVVDKRADDFPGGGLLLLLWWGRQVGHFFFSLLVSLVFLTRIQFGGRGGKGRENLAFDWPRLILGGLRLGPWRIDLGKLGNPLAADRELTRGSKMFPCSLRGQGMNPRKV
jgi:hypothetical protein